MAMGERLRTQRQQKGWTLDDVHEKTGITGPWLSKIERGLALPSAELVELLAGELDFEPDGLQELLAERTKLAWAEQLGVEPGITETFVTMTRLDSDARTEVARVTETLERLDTDTRQQLLIGLRGIRESIEGVNGMEHEVGSEGLRRRSR